MTTFQQLAKLLLGAIALTAATVACSADKNHPQTAALLSQTATASDGHQSAEAATRQADRAKTVPMYEIPAQLKDRPEQILVRKGYTVSYNKNMRTANWVAWHLTKAHTYGRQQRSGEVFTADADVPSPRATDNDYYNSGYDRGHMCPAGDSKWDGEAMSQSFLFTNVCPQNHNLNKYEWNEVELLCREWARQYGAVDVVCGPVYSQGASTYSVGQQGRRQKTIGSNQVAVPDGFFKVVLCRQGKAKAIGFYFKNQGKKQPIAEAVCTVDEIEQMTGIDFFPALDDKTETAVEAKAQLSDW